MDMIVSHYNNNYQKGDWGSLSGAAKFESSNHACSNQMVQGAKPDIDLKL